MGTVLDVMAGESTLSDLILDVLAEAHEKGGVASFRHNGKKKKGIVIGKKGEHLVVARGQERHLVKNGESQRMMEAAETVEPLEVDQVFVDSVLDEAAEAMADDGTVDLSNAVLLERLTPRQLRFLFATGAFKAGKAAARAVGMSSTGNVSVVVGAKGMSNLSGTSARGAPRTIRPAARAAAKQAMQQQLKTYKAMKDVGITGLNLRGAARGKLATRQLGFMRNYARSFSRASVK